MIISKIGYSQKMSFYNTSSTLPHSVKSINKECFKIDQDTGKCVKKVRNVIFNDGDIKITYILEAFYKDGFLIKLLLIEDIISDKTVEEYYFYNRSLILCSIKEYKYNTLITDTFLYLIDNKICLYVDGSHFNIKINESESIKSLIFSDITYYLDYLKK